MSTSTPSTATRFVRRSVLLNGLFVAEGASMFVLDMALAAALGLGAQSDILYAAWSLPMTIGRGMFQSLTNSFMGLFAEADDRTMAYNQAITVIGLVALLAAALMSAGARWWYPLSVPGASVETRLAGQPLAAVLAWLIFLLALAETFRAIYYRAERLIVPSAGRIAGTLISVAVALVAGARQELFWVAWGLVAGALIETLVSFVGLFTLPEFAFRPSWPARAALADMARTVGMPLAGQSVRVVSSVGERALASYLGPGALTAVTFAVRLVATLERFVFRGFQLATIQAYTAGAKQNYNARLRVVALLAVPMAIVLALLSPQLIGVVFGRGRFSAEDVQTTALVLQTYAPAVLALALISVPLGLAFARKESRAVLGFFSLNAIVIIATELALIRLGLGLRSFGIANSLAAFAGFFWLKHTVARDEVLWTRVDTVQFLVVAVTAALGTLAVRALGGLLAADSLSLWLTLLAGGLACLASVGVAARLLRLEEFSQLARLVRHPRS